MSGITAVGTHLIKAVSRGILFVKLCIALGFFVWAPPLAAQDKLGQYEVLMHWQRPATMPGMEPYHGKTVGVGGFTGPEGTSTAMSRGLADIVAQVLTNCQRYTVLDRNRIEEVFKEQRLAMSGLLDESTVVEAGRLAGAQVMAVGRVQSDAYSEQWVRRKTLDENGKIVYTNVLVKNYQFAYTVQFLDVTTGAVVCQKSGGVQSDNDVALKFFTPKRGYERIAGGATASKASMQQLCLERAGLRLRQAVAPYVIKEKVKLEGRGKLKEPIKDIVVLFQLKETEEAMEKLRALAERSDLTEPEQAGMACNMGYLSNAEGDHCAAKEHFKRAYILAPREQDYRRLFDEMAVLCVEAPESEEDESTGTDDDVVNHTAIPAPVQEVSQVGMSTPKQDHKVPPAPSPAPEPTPKVAQAKESTMDRAVADQWPPAQVPKIVVSKVYSDTTEIAPSEDLARAMPSVSKTIVTPVYRMDAVEPTSSNTAALPLSTQRLVAVPHGKVRLRAGERSAMAVLHAFSDPLELDTFKIITTTAQPPAYILEIVAHSGRLLFKEEILPSGFERAARGAEQLQLELDRLRAQSILGPWSFGKAMPTELYLRSFEREKNGLVFAVSKEEAADMMQDPDAVTFSYSAEPDVPRLLTYSKAQGRLVDLMPSFP
jgi:hypothetical protein